MIFSVPGGNSCWIAPHCNIQKLILFKHYLGCAKIDEIRRKKKILHLRIFEIRSVRRYASIAKTIFLLFSNQFFIRRSGACSLTLWRLRLGALLRHTIQTSHSYPPFARSCSSTCLSSPPGLQSRLHTPHFLDFLLRTVRALHPGW